MLRLPHRSDWMLFASSSVGLNGLILRDLGVEGDWLLSRLRFRALGEWVFLVWSPWIETELRLEVMERRSPFTCSLSIESSFSHGRAAIHRSSQFQPQRGLFGSMNVWFAELVELLLGCWYIYKNFKIHVNSKREKEKQREITILPDVNMHKLKPSPFS